jgi:hypothetical protein
VLALRAFRAALAEDSAWAIVSSHCRSCTNKIVDEDGNNERFGEGSGRRELWPADASALQNSYFTSLGMVFVVFAVSSTPLPQPSSP